MKTIWILAYTKGPNPEPIGFDPQDLNILSIHFQDKNRAVTIKFDEEGTPIIERHYLDVAMGALGSPLGAPLVVA